MVNYYQIPPSTILAPYIRFFWVFEMDGIAGDPYVYRSMADSCTEMIFHYKGRFHKTDDSNIEPFSIVQGASRSYNRYTTVDDFGIIGVYLYPFAANALLGTTAHEISNQSVDLYTLLGADGRSLEEQVMLAADNKARLQILSSFLEQRLLKEQPTVLPLHHAIRQVIHANIFTSTNELSEQYCLSRRQFERKFKEYSGFSPKLYNRIVRFGKAMNNYGLKHKSLTDIAYDCGYYDQSHFIHDFKEFSGYHPKQYFSGKAEGIEYRDI